MNLESKAIRIRILGYPPYQIPIPIVKNFIPLRPLPTPAAPHLLGQVAAIITWDHKVPGSSPTGWR